MTVRIFHPKALTPPKDKIYQRLGYSKRTTKMTVAMQAKIDGMIDDAMSLIELIGASAFLDVQKIQKGKIFLSKKVSFFSKDLEVFLKGSSSVLLLAATAGPNIIKAVQEYSDKKDLTRAVVYDAVAGELVDESLGWIMAIIRQELLRENKKLDPRRFSAGYGDLDIKNQKIFYDILCLKKIGIRITKEYLLIPEKSVTALSGVRLLRS